MKKFLIVIVCWVASFAMLKFRRQVKDFIGNVDFAERFLGSGGTNTLVVLLALVLFFGSIAWATGALGSVLDSFLGPLFGN